MMECANRKAHAAAARPIGKAGSNADQVNPTDHRSAIPDEDEG